MSNNLRIKAENDFRKEISIFEDARTRFEEKFNVFKEHTELKREWIDERSEKWHENEDNDAFNTYVQEVEEYNSTLEDLLNELSNLDLPENEAI